MPIDLDRLEALAAKATPGLWTAHVARLCIKAEVTSAPNGAFIAACDPDTILALVARLHAAEVVCDSLDRDRDPGLSARTHGALETWRAAQKGGGT